MPYRPSVRQLEYLVAVAETAHFGNAARRCAVSQPALSVQLGLLERQLGVTLIERTPGRIAPTPLGARIAASARSILSGLDDIVALAESDRLSLGGLIQLGVTPSFGPYFLPKLLPRLHADYPALQLYIREDPPHVVEREVASGVLDCGLGPRPDHLPGIDFAPLCTERIYLGVPKGHRLARRASVHPKDLAAEKLLTLGKTHRLFDNIKELAAIAGAEIVDRYEGTSLAALAQMVSIGMGLSVFPELYCRAELSHGEFITLLPIRGWKSARTIGYFWRRASGRDRQFSLLAAESRKALADTGLGRRRGAAEDGPT